MDRIALAEMIKEELKELFPQHNITTNCTQIILSLNTTRIITIVLSKNRITIFVEYGPAELVSIAYDDPNYFNHIVNKINQLKCETNT